MAEEQTTPPALLVEYKNWEGKTGIRRILPSGPPKFEATKWHPEPQWLLPARDVDRDVERDFALADLYPVHSSGLERLEIIGRLVDTIVSLTNAAVMAETSLRNVDNHYRADALRKEITMARATVGAIGPETLAEARARHFQEEGK